MNGWWARRHVDATAVPGIRTGADNQQLYFPMTLGSPVVLSLHTADDVLVDSVVTIVDVVDGSRLKLSIIGGSGWNNPELQLSLLIADGAAAKRVKVTSYEWDTTIQGSLWVELEPRYRLSDQRRHARVDVQLPAVLAVPDDGEHTKQLRARIVNLSAGGARVVFAHDEATFALRSSIFLRFAVDDELPLLVLGRIVEAKRQNDIETVLRLEFMSMDDDRRSRLAAYVQSLLRQELVEHLVSE